MVAGLEEAVEEFLGVPDSKGSPVAEELACCGDDYSTPSYEQALVGSVLVMADCSPARPRTATRIGDSRVGLYATDGGVNRGTRAENRLGLSRRRSACPGESGQSPRAGLEAPSGRSGWR